MPFEVNVLKRWYKIDLNPVPWTLGPIARTKKGAFVAKHEGLAQYQRGVKSALEDQNAELLNGSFRMEIFFWRRIEAYLTPQARTAHSHEADATNLQKAFEDGCAKVLFKNDVYNRWVTSVVVEQNETCTPKIICSIEPVHDDQIQIKSLDIPDYLLANTDQQELFGSDEEGYNAWPPREKD